jgi:hypothetical protein
MTAAQVGALEKAGPCLAVRLPSPPPPPPSSSSLTTKENKEDKDVDKDSAPRLLFQKQMQSVTEVLAKMVWKHGKVRWCVGSVVVCVCERERERVAAGSVSCVA